MSDYGGPSLDLLVGASAYRLGKNIEQSKGGGKVSKLGEKSGKSTIHA